MTQLVNAADHGVPQRRERVFFVGFREDTNVSWHFPQATHSRDALVWDQLHGTYWDRHKVARKQRPVGKGAGASLDPKTPPSEKPWRTVWDAISDLPDPEGATTFDIPVSNHRLQPGARSYPGHTGSPIHEPAKTLKAGVHGVPGGENMLLLPNGRVRYFTVRESARLQTFPDEFVFHGSWSETMRQLGNAVPVKLAEVVGKSVARHVGA
ncbi:DNA cytosine methyltransferase [Rhizobium leguminosarum]|uniref:DNA cytosine methyltransferase n=1 Tax=Rhizobium leguminosarum TaxID=384 RepID=UPI0028C4BC97|nr:DNA cytosine methyltransferase [Rhizobium leguminosarum]